MIKCPFCGTTHVANTLFCSECGTYLLEDDRRGTDPLGTDEIGWVGEEEGDGESSAFVKGTGPLAVRLRIVGTGPDLARLKARPHDDGSAYYVAWLEALETLVVEKGAASAAALQDFKEAWRTAYETTPHGKPVELKPTR